MYTIFPLTNYLFQHERRYADNVTTYYLCFHLIIVFLKKKKERQNNNIFI